jgi:pyruvate dehydrogenase E1 component
MYGENPENVYYYLTVYNEPYPQPPEPEGLDVEGVLRGMYLLAPVADATGPRAQLLASGVAVNWALHAQQLLATEWGVAADVWSVTSWNELRRDGLDCDRHNLLNPGAPPRTPYVTTRLAEAPGPVIAVSDYMRQVQDQIRAWVRGDYASLGTDGWGMSDTRGALRRHFLVDAQSIVTQTLSVLEQRGEVPAGSTAKAIDSYQLDDPSAADAGNTEGSG